MLLTGGTGNHLRFGWSFNVNNTQKEMIPCKECEIRNNKKSKGLACENYKCKNCHNFWENINNMTQMVDDKYPRECATVKHEKENEKNVLECKN